MAAADFGLIVSNFSNTSTYTVLADGQLVLVAADGQGNVTASFFSGDGTPLSGPVALNAGGAPSFTPGVGGVKPLVAALPNGGFAVLGQTNISNTSSDYSATFDAQGHIVSAWAPADTHQDYGSNTLTALSNNGLYVGWDDSTNGGVQYNPLVSGDTQFNYAYEGNDAHGAIVSPAGAVTSSFTYDSGLLTTLGTSNTYNGLAGDQLLGQAIQLADGAVVQGYLDQQFYDIPTIYGPEPGSAPAVSFSINGGPRTLVYHQGPPVNANATGPAVDTTSGVQALAMSNGTFAIFYTVYDNSTPARVHTTYAAFYNADGTQAGAQVPLLQRAENFSGNSNYPGGPPSVVALPSGGFAMAYYSEPTAGSGTVAYQVSLFDAAGNITQTIPVPFSPVNGSTTALAVGPNGSLYVEDDFDNVYAIVGTAPGDVAIDDSVDTSAATLAGTSAMRNYIVAGSGATTLLAGSAAATLKGGSGGDLFELQSSSAQVKSVGVDTIIGSTASATISAGGAAVFFGASGATLFNALGASSTLVGGGAETVNAAAANVLLFGGPGAVTFNAGSGASTVVSGAGGATITGGTTGLLYFGTGPTTYVPGAAVDTVIGFTGSLTATGGANGTLIFSGTGGNNSISSGAGSSTIFGYGANDSLVATGAGANVVAATAAAETVDGSQSSGANTFFAYGAGDVVVGGAGSTAIQSGLGNHTLVAGRGSTVFDVLAGTANRTVTIENFNPAQDFVRLDGYNAGAAASALQSAVTAGGAEVLTLVDGTRVAFVGVTGLTSSSFV